MKLRKGFVIDVFRCIGCDTCSIACKMENDVP
ncbi:MAG: 4Fe-4S dicluster domain-containing protein, partial [Gammaproteobacteria bacterium]|nr:4Fe-4S dicluster domain-containing protein [Gammaproteobacteria bacterium]